MQGCLVPDFGRPQDVIFNQVNPESWDLFVGILWHRFGTPAGASHPTTGQNMTGTQEEFVTAYNLWKEHKRPRLMIYRCMRPIPQEDLDPEQIQQVRKYFAHFGPDGDHPGVYKEYRSEAEFQKLVREHLTHFLVEYAKTEQQHVLSVADVSSLTPRALETLPPRNRYFIGRIKEIEEARWALRSEMRGWGLVIDGFGGIGKTALAIELAHRYKAEKRFEIIIFVTAKIQALDPDKLELRTDLPAPTRTLDGLINECARALGQSAIEQMPGGPEKERAILEALERQSTLIIFDNLETLSNQDQKAVGDFLRTLPTTCKAIVTTRRRVSDATTNLRLNVLSWEEAEQLIQEEIERFPDQLRSLREASREQRTQLCRDAGRSPLAMLWVMGFIRARNWTLQQALGLLRNGAVHRDLNAFIYQEAWGAMTSSAQLTLRALSFFDSPATPEALATTVGSAYPGTLEADLEKLSQMSMVDVIEGTTNLDATEERYSLQALTNQYARVTMREVPETEQFIGMRFVDYWLHYARQYGSAPPFERIDAELANIEAAANWLQEKIAGGPSPFSDRAKQKLIDLAQAMRSYYSFKKAISRTA